MKPSRKTKAAALLFALFLAALLSGCVVNPDSSGNNSNAGAGYTDQLPFPLLPTPTPQPTAISTISIVTPSPAPQGFTTPFPWMQPTAVPGAFVTPTFSVILPATMFPLVTGTPTPAPTSSALRLGSQGDAVRSLQARLISLGYMKGPSDGDFGKVTEAALIAFQRRNNLTADGIAGPATLARLNSTAALRPTSAPTPTRRPTSTPYVNKNTYLKTGSSGSDVRKMQDRLIALGYLAGSATGYFDGATEAAVIAFQKRNVSYFDGVAGPMTLEKLYSSSARKTSTVSGIIGISLKKGLNDSPAVRALQARLKELGYYAGAIDGDFGASTETAVKSFQAQNGLKADGIAGDGTCNLLFSGKAKRAGAAPRPTPTPTRRITPVPEATPITVFVNVTPDPSGGYVTLRAGNSGTLVRNLQQALKDQGFLSGAVDGKYGLATIEAVRSFQASKGLSQDGVAGPATQRILYEGNYPAGS